MGCTAAAAAEPGGGRVGRYKYYYFTDSYAMRGEFQEPFRVTEGSKVEMLSSIQT